MLSKDMLVELVSVFPELELANVDWNKEVFAHFGLAFMKVALLEHCLINAYTAICAAKDFKESNLYTQENWENTYDRAFETAKSKTFGNLKKLIVATDGFDHLEAHLEKTKRLRDYFAHHFMREDADYMASESGCILLIYNLYKSSMEIKNIELMVEDAAQKFYRRLGIPEVNPENIQSQIDEMKAAAAKRLIEGRAKVGWAFDAL